MSNTTALTTATEPTPAYMPALTVQEAARRYNVLVAFTKEQMIEGKDFGTIPGSPKPTLLKPGAEKLCTLFGLEIEDPELLERTEDWTGDAHGGEPFFHYLIRQRLKRNGKVVASQMGSCNSWEKKYRWRWVPESDLPPGLDSSLLRRRPGAIREPAFAIEKGETSGKYGKPAAQWERFRAAKENGTARRVEWQSREGKRMVGYEIDDTLYRVPNEDVAEQVNTILKMAQKRALIAAVLLAVNASEFFTQDLEDLEVIDVEYTAAPAQQQPARAEPKPPEKGNGNQPSMEQRLRQRSSDFGKQVGVSATELYEVVCGKAKAGGLGSDPAGWKGHYQKIGEYVEEAETELRNKMRDPEQDIDHGDAYEPSEGEVVAPG